MRQDLLELFEVSELKKYMTDEELAGLPGYAEAAEEKAPAPPDSAPPARPSAAPARKTEG
jgi:hypothetical protein